MIRSSEVQRNQKESPKVMDHMRIHPQMGGGVRIEHHFTDFQHAPKVHEFDAEAGDKMAEHIFKYTGMKYGDGGADHGSADDAEETE